MVAPILVGLGFRELSMSAPLIPEVKSVIRSLTVADAEQLVDRVQQLPTAALIREAVLEYLDSLGVKPS
jgi:phosphoenolpyruvate-protein kinase (PTS system EI component)